MATWSELEAAAPEIAAAARRLMVGADGVAIAFLATASAEARPHLSPVCPVFCGNGLYLCASARTPKVRDLHVNPVFVLHAFLGENDEELQVSGTASEVSDVAERGAVHDAIPFAAFDRSDPIFRLEPDRALQVYWERVGQPDTKPVRRRWQETPAGG